MFFLFVKVVVEATGINTRMHIMGSGWRYADLE